MAGDSPPGASEAGEAPKVAIVGRPNVGKSSLLNLLARRRIAIVHPTSGVTRDRVTALVEHAGTVFELWDTGGMGAADAAEIEAEVQAQIEIALRRADVLLFVVDAATGYDGADHAIARKLRRIGRPVLLVANKVDDASREGCLPELLRLGLGEAVPVSALHGYGRSDLLDAIVRILPRTPRPPSAETLAVAVVGRQNVGKSTLTNRLAGEERVIVSERPGTTRDAVDVRFTWEGREFLLIDTAGVKRRSKVRGAVEFYSVHRAERSVRRSDVTILMLDATRTIGRTDKKIAAYVERQAKPCVLFVNKWDLSGETRTGEHLRYLEQELRVLTYAPVVFGSALDGTNVGGLLRTAQDLYRQAGLRVGTGELNRAIQEATRQNPPPRHAGRSSKVLYATQIGVHPPTVVVFMSGAGGFTAEYRRYLAAFLAARRTMRWGP